MAIFGLIVLFGIFSLGHAAVDVNITLKYEDIIDWLRTNSDADVIPISKKDPKPVEVRMDMSLLYVVGLEEQSDIVELVVRQRQTWYNKALAWDQTHSNQDIENVTLSLRYLWEPDFTATSAVSTPELLSPEIAVVSSNGEIQYESQLRLVVHTDLSRLQSPAGANVSFTYKSWAYDNSELTLANPRASSFVADEFESRTFQVSNTTVTKNIVQSPTTWRHYDVHTFTFTLKKLN